MRMVWKTLRLRHLGLAFFWACSMLTFRSSILLSGPLYTTGYQTLIVIVSFVANMTTLFLVASRMERNPSFYDKLPPTAFTASIVTGLVLLAGSGAAGSAGLLSEPVTIAVLMTGSVLAGVGYGYFWGSWAECLGRMHPSRTSFYLPWCCCSRRCCSWRSRSARRSWACPRCCSCCRCPSSRSCA
nr:hypothetical protein [Eggerthella sinensis]